jgi:hypothetical protein
MQNLQAITLLLLLVTVPLPARYASAIEPKMLYISIPPAWETKGSARQATRGAHCIEITRGYAPRSLAALCAQR